MIPDPGKALSDLAINVASLALELTSSYSISNAGMISMLLSALAADADRAVANRFDDVADMESIFERAGHAPGADAREAFRADEPATLKLSDVSAWHARGMALLIELHAWAEREDAELDGAIWEFLCTHAERNALGA